jgi:hypothetical protein
MLHPFSFLLGTVLSVVTSQSATVLSTKMFHLDGVITLAAHVLL